MKPHSGDDSDNIIAKYSLERSNENLRRTSDALEISHKVFPGRPQQVADLETYYLLEQQAAPYTTNSEFFHQRTLKPIL
ncbi:hypothetical protein J6590_050597 [Homalodisca vitripennis]|nr:hypothetical protein J6590_050597 [Homalodisca vitripennis]